MDNGMNAASLKRGYPAYFKGYGVNYINGNYRAAAYANPEFENKSLSKLKKEINQYLIKASSKHQRRS
jgi:hypothetical protein